MSRPLLLIDGTAFPALSAVDNDGGTFGDVGFELASFQANSDADQFTVLKVDTKSAQLYLQRPVEARLYHVSGGHSRCKCDSNECWSFGFSDS